MTINEPSLDPNKDTATLAWEKSVTEATNRMQHQIDNINESVNVPQNLIAVYSKTQDGAVQQFTPFADGDGFVAYVAYTDNLPTLPVSGATFSAYSDEEIDVIIKQYRESANRPTNPGTTSYQVSGAVWSSSPNWTKTKLNRAGVNVWFSEARIIGQAGQTVTAKWSNAKLLYGGAVANGILYYNVASTSAPSAPTADGYDYDSGVFNNLTSGWQYEPITTAMGGGTTISHKHWQVTFHVETDESTNGQIITFGSVEGVIPIGSTLQSDNFSAGSAGWQIVRNTGNAEFNNITARGVLDASSITTGTLDCSGITVSNLNAGSITTGNLSATRINGGTLTIGNVTVSGAFVADNLNTGVIIKANGFTAAANANLSNSFFNMFTTENNPNFDTDLVFYMLVSANRTGSSYQSAGINLQVDGTNQSTVSANSSSVNVVHTGDRINVAKNKLVRFNPSATKVDGGNNPGSTYARFSGLVMEVRRTA
tara:strand:+ start:798 stop:2243 length:1446 start_codon:yes stop_codon:yes gene_type:complete